MWYKEQSHQATPEAKKLGELLKRRGWHIQYEKDDGHKHIDIAITEAKVNIEVDGSQHNWDPRQALSDLQRTYYSFRKGFFTLRIPNALVRDDKEIADTADFIDKVLKEGMWQNKHHWYKKFFRFNSFRK